MSELRESGIDVLGKIPWGSHFCNFYDTKEDLFDILVSYFKSGLENNEYCLWVVSVPGLVAAEEIKLALGKSIPLFDKYLAERKMEIIDSAEWYLEENTFNAEKAINALQAKLKKALALGYDGIRVSGDTRWLNEQFWKDFYAYEKKLNNSTVDIPVIVLCAYPLADLGAADIFDIAQVHQFAIAKRKGKWEVIEAAAQKEARAEIRRLTAELKRSRIKVSEPRAALRYGVAVLSVVAALAVAIFLDLHLISAPVSLFLCALMFSAWYGGIKPGLLSMLLSLLAFKFYFIAPIHSLAINISEVPRLLIFILSALFVLLLSADQRNKTESIRRARNILEGVVQKLQNTNAALQGEIAERRHAEALLHTTEQEFRAIVENTPDHIVRFNREFYPVYVNPAVLKAYGVSLQDLVGKPVGPSFRELGLDIIEKGELKLLLELIAKVFSTGQPVQVEMDWPSAEGLRFFSAGLFPEFSNDNSVINVLVIGRDITARKHMEDALRESELRLRQITENIHEVFWMATPGLDESLYVSPSYENIWGRSVESLQQQPQSFFEGIHREDQGRVMNIIKEKRDQEFDIEYRILKPDGTVRWIRDRGFPVKDESGKVYRITGVSEDITVRKEAEDELRLAYQRLSYHFENTPLAVIELDKDLFIKRWSKRAEEIFGWKASEALGKNVYSTDFPIIYKEDIPAVDTINEQLTKGAVDRNLSLNRNYTKDGRVIYSEWYNSVLRDEQGNVITILSLVHNVTERKKAEETLNQSYEEIRRLTAHLQNIREEERIVIAREIHDELGQQLTVLKMEVKGLNKKLDSASEAIRYKIAEIIDLLDAMQNSVSRISSELRPSLLHNLGLAAAVEWHLKEFEKRWRTKTVFNELSEEPDLPDPIKNGLFRIFQESLTNISKHANAKKIKVTLEQKEKQLILSIEDDGQGFKQEEISSKKTLGILGMRERAQVMGGNYEISSVPGKGTVVVVSVPCKRN
jgi:PAS domain S-box-containing protein